MTKPLSRLAAATLSVAWLLTIAAAPGLARADSVSTRHGSAFRGLGPRVGLGSDPDQLLLGMHFDLGRIAPDVRFQPDFEIGLGDDRTILAGTFPVHYLFPVEEDIQPYAGAGLAVGLIDDDRGGRYVRNNDDTDLELAFVLIGGLQWRLSRTNRFLLELNLVAGDLHDFELVAGWTFR
jgi:opacity protein-like surface antigen